MNDFNPGYNPYRRQEYPPRQDYMPRQPIGYALRPVTSKEEAVAAQIDFAGPGTIMPDPGHGVIYLKRFNPDTGSADFMTFVPYQEPPAPEYATAQDMAEIRGVIGGLREEIERLKKPGKAVKKDDAE